MQRIKIIDSHTGGEPTRVIVGGGPNLGDGSLREQLNCFRESFDHIRTATNLEPRGSDVLVGALLCEPTDPSCAAGVIFFNNAGYLHMCGHGTIGLMVTLLHMKRISPGVHKIESPVGVVTANLLDDHQVSVENVPSYRYRKAVTVNVPGHGDVAGDIAWGGNWFFLVADHGKDLVSTSTRDLADFALEIRAALEKENITGADGGEIDHIELFGPPVDTKQNHSRNFVLCPGGAFDRSPCGTGTSAKLACLAADGKLSPGEVWRQESIVGSVFEGSYKLDDAGSPARKFTEFLATRGKRLTEERGIIVREIFSSDSQFDAEEIVARLDQSSDGKRASRATIYRAIGDLEEAGLIRKVARTNDRDIYLHDFSCLEQSSDNEGVTIVPTITGSAWVTAESELLLDPSDPFKAGFEL